MAKATTTTAPTTKATATAELPDLATHEPYRAALARYAELSAQTAMERHRANELARQAEQARMNLPPAPSAVTAAATTILANGSPPEREARLRELSEIRERAESAAFKADAYAEAARRFKEETFNPALREAQAKLCPAVFESHWKPAIRRLFSARAEYDAALRDARKLADELNDADLFTTPITDVTPFHHDETPHWADDLIAAGIVTAAEVAAAGVRKPE